MQIADFFDVTVNDILNDRKFQKQPSLLFRSALNYTEATDELSDKIGAYIEKYYKLAKSAGRNVSFFPEQYNLQIEVNDSVIDINYELDDYTSKYKLNDKLDGEIEYIANDQRRMLGLEDQGAISLIAAVAARGINVIFLNFGSPEVFGLSVCDNLYGSYVFINDSEGITAERKLFTLAHEYGHLLLHRPLYSRHIEKYMPQNKRKSILDSMADCFAGYLLCPYHILSKYADVLSSLKSLSELIPIKKEMQISLSSLMTTLNKYSYINNSTMNSYYAFLRKNKLEKKEINSFVENDALKRMFEVAKKAQTFSLLKLAHQKNTIPISDICFILDVSMADAKDIIGRWNIEADTAIEHDFKF